MSPARKARLDALGFTWNTKEEQWTEMYERLKEQVREHGHTRVPQNSALGKWVVRQRQAKANGHLSQDSIARLDEIGFSWQPQVSKWDQQLKRLSDLKQAGEPWNPPLDPKLAKWLKHQRHYLKVGKLSRSRAERLQAVLEAPPGHVASEQSATSPVPAAPLASLPNDGVVTAPLSCVSALSQQVPQPPNGLAAMLQT
jgi:hypothetical protein